jgi:hypothetical protein
MSEPDFDIAAAHKYFAASCFNRAWDLIDKASDTGRRATVGRVMPGEHLSLE